MAKKPGYWQGTDHHPLRDFLGSQMGSDSETSLEVSWWLKIQVCGDPKPQNSPAIFFPRNSGVFFFRYVVQVAHMTIKPLSQWSDD